VESGNYYLASPPMELMAVAGAMTDLRIVREMLQHCLETDGELHSECEELEEACWTTAVLRYERCFSNRPWPYKKVIEERLSRDHLVTHHFFRYLRDKMFSHSVGVGEDFEITAYIFTNSAGIPQIVGIGPRPRRICSPGEDLAREFLELVEVVSRLVSNHFESIRTTLITELRSFPVASVVKGRPVKQKKLDISKDEPGFQKYLARALGA